MHSSILEDIKKLLGLHPEIEDFDTDIKIGINSAFMTLAQLGVMDDNYAIQDAGDIWSDIKNTDKNSEVIKSDIYLKVRLFFDPPGNSFLVEAIKNQIQEMEWRMRENVTLKKG